MDRIDMGKVVALVAAEGVSANIEHTGGGCWTIYAGPTRPEEGWGERWAAVAGPGWREADGSFQGLPGDFYVGPDDDGQTGDQVFNVDALGVRTDEDVAKLIVAQARLEDPTQALTVDQVTALGLDGTARGIRQ